MKPITSEQVAVYRAFVSDYAANSKSPINLANTTRPLDADEGDYAGCMKHFPKGERTVAVHRFKEEFKQDPEIRVVDPDKYEIADPSDAMRQGESVDDAVMKGFRNGLLSVSEIIFDGPHRHAALQYSFHCGRLCGNGGTIILELSHGRWKRSKQSCGLWMS